MRRGRKKVENPATARRILAAAEDHFAARGIAGARTEEIATAAHANKAMLYYYFGNKRQLHRAVLENLFRELRKGVFQARRAGTAGQRLESLVSGYFDFLGEHRNYPRLVQREAMGATKNVTWVVRQYLRPFHKVMVRTIEDGIASGEFRRVDPDHTVFSILGMTMSYFAAAPILSKVARRDLLEPGALEQRRRALLDFLNHGLRRSRARAR
ncbi:MAG: TetR/AcrR family transcriptional regulator [Candidatus Acidiferrales bacterium]